MTTGKTCSVEGCDREVASRGMCNAHYIRWRRYGDPLGGPTPRAVKICIARDCERRARAKGLCSTHYAQARADRDPRLNVSLCSVEGCGANVDSRGLCNRHRIRAQRHGDPEARLTAETPEDAFMMYVEREGDCHVWTGTRYANGYGRVKRDGKAIRAHRYAWERENGPIPDGLVVDHICHERLCAEISHLRLATNQQNTWNKRGVNPASTSGWRGVQKRGNSHGAYVDHDGKRIGLGSYSTAEEAGRVASKARRARRGEFAGADQ